VASITSLVQPESSGARQVLGNRRAA
jgi:hypothetical protein